MYMHKIANLNILFIFVILTWEEMKNKLKQKNRHGICILTKTTKTVYKDYIGIFLISEN